MDDELNNKLCDEESHQRRMITGLDLGKASYLHPVQETFNRDMMHAISKLQHKDEEPD